MQLLQSRPLIPKAKKEGQNSSQIKKFTTFLEPNNKQTGGQENNFPIINLWNKQTVSRQNFFQCRKASKKNRQSDKNKVQIAPRKVIQIA